MTEELAGNLIVEDREILLLYREGEEHCESQRSQGESSTSNLEGYWKLPGGKVGSDESPTEAAVREAKDEIGVEPSLERPFYSGEFQKGDKIFLWHCYQASIDREPEIKEEKFERIEWFEASELDELELALNIEMILPALRKL